MFLQTLPPQHSQKRPKPILLAKTVCQAFSVLLVLSEGWPILVPTILKRAQYLKKIQAVASKEFMARASRYCILGTFVNWCGADRSGH